MLRCKNLADLNLDEKDPWKDILNSVAYAIRSTYSRTRGATPAQLIYGRDMIFPIQHIADWEYIRQRRTKAIQKANTAENSKRKSYDYSVGNQVLILNTDIQRKLNSPTQGPFRILRVFANGTVSIQRGAVTERLNIRRIAPYHTNNQ